MYNLYLKVTDEVGDIDEFSTVNYLLLQIFVPKNKEVLVVLIWQHNIINILKSMFWQIQAKLVQRNKMKNAQTAKKRGMHASWLMQMPNPGFHLYIEVIQTLFRFPSVWSSHILLTYVSTDLPFIQRSLLQTMRKQDTLFLFFSGPSPLLIHLFEGLSVAWIAASDKHGVYTGCSNKCNIYAVTQSFKNTLRNKAKKDRKPWIFFFCILIIRVFS